jgi:geranylgeranyl pyrophosphate synthase
MLSNLAVAESVTDQRVDQLEERLFDYLRCYPIHSSELLESSLYAVGSPGRRWRPILFLTLYDKLSGGHVTEDAYRVACAVEYLHTASIILDDLPAMDGGTLRRGRQACHLEFSPARAILTAFFLCDVAQHMVRPFESLNIAPTSVLENLFRSTKSEMMRGQILDLEREDQSLAEVVEKYRLKSGALYALASCLPAHMLGLTDIVDKLHNFGSYLGIAYQIWDDIHDQVCTFEDTGKDTGQDKTTNTIVRLLGIEGAIELATSYRKKSISELEDAPILVGLSELIAKICRSRAPNRSYAEETVYKDGLE